MFDSGARFGSFVLHAVRRGLVFGSAPRAGESSRTAVRFDILRVLWDAPRCRSDIALAIEAHCEYRPRAESVDRALQMLEDGRFVTSRLLNAQRVYAIAESGSEMLANYHEHKWAEASAGRPESIARSER